MSSASKAPVPPYLNIDPATAAAKLSDPIDTTRFAKAAAFAAKGREDLAKRGHAPDGAKRLRRFSTWEVCRYLIPVAASHFRRVLKANPDLPQGTGEGNSKWFTLDDVLTLRKHFASEGAADREYLPYRPGGLPAKIISVANFKGGVGKTSTAAHLAMSAALDGYKVLVIDLDSQGSMTSIMGGQVQDEWQTAFPLMAKDFAMHLEADAARGAQHVRPRSNPSHPLAQHRSDRSPTEPLLGGIPSSCMADAKPLLAALGCVNQRTVW